MPTTRNTSARPVKRPSTSRATSHAQRRGRAGRRSRPRPFLRFVGALLTISVAALIIAGAALAQGQASGATALASHGKHILAAPQPVHQTHKRTLHRAALATSCGGATLPQAGVVNVAPPSTAQYQLASVAIGVWGAHAYQLFGGALLSDPTQGVILITPIVADPCHAQAQGANPQPIVVLTPTRGGAVTFTSVVGKVVAYTTASGASGRLDYTSHTFVG